MRGLSDIDLTRLKAVREELFLTSKELNLTDSRDVLVNRKLAKFEREIIYIYTMSYVNLHFEDKVDIK